MEKYNFSEIANKVMNENSETIKKCVSSLVYGKDEARTATLMKMSSTILEILFDIINNADKDLLSDLLYNSEAEGARDKKENFLENIMTLRCIAYMTSDNIAEKEGYVGNKQCKCKTDTN